MIYCRPTLSNTEKNYSHLIFVNILAAPGITSNLRYVDMNVILNSECAAVYGTATVRDSVICTGTNGGIVSTCIVIYNFTLHQLVSKSTDHTPFFLFFLGWFWWSSCMDWGWWWGHCTRNCKFWFRLWLRVWRPRWLYACHFLPRLDWSQHWNCHPSLIKLFRIEKY